MAMCYSVVPMKKKTIDFSKLWDYYELTYERCDYDALNIMRRKLIGCFSTFNTGRLK